MTIKYIPLNQLRRTAEPKRGAVECLKHSLKRYGLIYPLVVTPVGEVIDGNARHRALLELLPETTPVPCIVLEEPTDPLLPFVLSQTFRSTSLELLLRLLKRYPDAAACLGLDEDLIRFVSKWHERLSDKTKGVF